MASGVFSTVSGFSTLPRADHCNYKVREKNEHACYWTAHNAALFLSHSPFPPPDMSGNTTPSPSEEHAYLLLIAAARAKVTPGKTTDLRSRVEDVVKSTWSVVKREYWMEELQPLGCCSLWRWLHRRCCLPMLTVQESYTDG